MFLRRRPTPALISAFLEASRDLPLSYASIRLSGRLPGERSAQPTAGFRLDERRTVIGRGDAVLARARAALQSWKHFDLGWVELLPADAPVQPGTVVAVLVRHLGFWSLNGCRVIDVIEGTDEYGFAYGTLTNHAERGEELFTVSLDRNSGAVSYLIRAVSQPRAPLARIGYPVTRSLQARFRRDSSAAMARAVAE